MAGGSALASKRIMMQRLYCIIDEKYKDWLLKAMLVKNIKTHIMDREKTQINYEKIPLILINKMTTEDHASSCKEKASIFKPVVDSVVKQNFQTNATGDVEIFQNRMKDVFVKTEASVFKKKVRSSNFFSQNSSSSNTNLREEANTKDQKTGKQITFKELVISGSRIRKQITMRAMLIDNLQKKKKKEKKERKKLKETNDNYWRTPPATPNNFLIYVVTGNKRTIERLASFLPEDRTGRRIHGWGGEDPGVDVLAMPVVGAREEDGDPRAA
ncbi:hypothetical protein WN51_02100 [Melipona quadrifasciata]|uniref:Uncharacterized protein n=1 Tax=Melipona quadrifasciata TaxID=166423 RepID=A0A0N1ITF0_9HYME|nr:hypothetical protein WN51_02100 [Melipona quadrifasciata]